MAKGLAGASIKVALEGDPKGFVQAAKTAGKAVNGLTKDFGASREEAVRFIDDLGRLKQVAGFAALQKNLKENQSALAAQKLRVRELGAEYRKTGDALAKLAYEASKERVQRLSHEVKEQTAALRAESVALREVGVNTSDLVGEQKRLTSSLDKQEQAWKEQAQAEEASARALKERAAAEERAAKAQRIAAAETKKRIANEKRYQEYVGRTSAKLKALRGELVAQQRAQAGWAAALGTTQKGMQRLDGLVSGLFNKWSLLFSGISLGALSREIFTAGTQAQALQSSFLTIAGSSRAAGDEIEYVRQVSKDLGLQFQVVADDYKSLAAASKGTALEGQVTRDIFLGISQASTVLGLSADQASGALQAVQQMISKGKVQAEELRGQLGERLPGAFQMAADAIGVTTAELDKMLLQGQVTAEMLLPKLAKALQDKFAAGARAAAGNAQQALNRLLNSWYEFKVALAESGFLDFATEKINDLSAALNDPAVRSAAIELMQSFLSIADSIYKFVINYGAMVAKVGGSLAALALLNKAVLTLVTTWKGLNAVMAMTTGLQVVPFLKTFGATAAGLVAPVMSLQGALLGLGAAWGVYKIYQAGKALLEMREAYEMAGQAVEGNEAQQAKFQDRLEKISKESGVVVTSYKEMREAFTSGAIAYDQATDTYSKGSGLIEEAAEQGARAAEHQQAVFQFSAEVTEEAAGKVKKSLKELKNEYASLVKEIDSIDQQLTKLADEGSADQLKLANAARSPIDAWKAQRKAALDLGPAMAAAKEEADRLAAAGDIEGANKSYARAVQLGKQMRDGFKELAVEVKAEFTPAMQEGLDKAKEAAKDFGKQYSDAMSVAKKAGDALKSTTESLAAAEQGLADAQREAARDGMSAAQAYRDIAAEQRELEAASKAAARVGDYDLAIAKAREAQQVASELNREVKDGEQAVVSAEQAKRNASQAELSARQLEIAALKAKQAAEKKAEEEAIALAEKAKKAKEAEAAKVTALEAKKAEVVKTEAEAAMEAARLEAEARQQITDILEAQRDVLTQLADQKNAEADWTLGDAYTEAGEQAKTLFDVNAQLQQQLKDIPAGAVIDWGSAWNKIEAAGVSAADEVNEKWDQATRDRYITTYVKEVQQRASGGFAGPVQGLAGGGMPRRLSSRYITGGAGRVDGYGPVMLDYHEFVLQRKAVHAPGLGGDGPALAWAHNRQDWSGMQALLSRHLGPAQVMVSLPSVPSNALGYAGKMNGPGNDGGEKTLVLSDPVTGQQAAVNGSQLDLDALERMLRHRGVVSSR